MKKSVTTKKNSKSVAVNPPPGHSFPRPDLVRECHSEVDPICFSRLLCWGPATNAHGINDESRRVLLRPAFSSRFPPQRECLKWWDPGKPPTIFFFSFFQMQILFTFYVLPPGVTDSQDSMNQPFWVYFNSALKSAIRNRVVEMVVVRNEMYQPTQMSLFSRQRIIKTGLERFCTLEEIETPGAVLGITMGPRKTRLAHRVFHHSKVGF